MEDLQKSKIFDDEVEDFGETDWEEYDIKALIEFSDISDEKKRDAIKNINHKEKEETETETESIKQRNRFFHSTEKRIQAKMKEMEDKGLIDPFVNEKDEKDLTKSINGRYGRNPLHEAVAMKDIHMVKKFVTEGLYLEDVDNNGHTPIEMAYYEGFKEAMIIFKNIQK